MKWLMKKVLALLMIGVSAFSVLFTGLWTLGTFLSWDDTGSKVMTFVFIVATIFIVGLASMTLEKYPLFNRSKRREMTGIEFEGYCGKYLLTHGFHDVIITPPTGDYGADIVAKDERGNLWVFQCKQYSSKLGNGCVQEVVAAKKHYGATKAGVMTNSKLTEKARELAFENEVILFECMD